MIEAVRVFTLLGLVFVVLNGIDWLVFVLSRVKDKKPSLSVNSWRLAIFVLVYVLYMFFYTDIM